MTIRKKASRKSVKRPSKSSKSRTPKKRPTAWQTIGIYLPAPLISKLKAGCKAREISRSALIANALTVYFARDAVAARVKSVAAKAGKGATPTK